MYIHDSFHWLSSRNVVLEEIESKSYKICNALPPALLCALFVRSVVVGLVGLEIGLFEVSLVFVPFCGR